MNFILGSSSPRRLELLGSIGINPDKVVSPNINEKINKNESPLEYSKRISYEKMISLINSFPKDILLTADTVAYCGRRLIDKTLKIDIAKIPVPDMKFKRQCLEFGDDYQLLFTVPPKKIHLLQNEIKSIGKKCHTIGIIKGNKLRVLNNPFKSIKNWDHFS